MKHRYCKGYVLLFVMIFTTLISALLINCTIMTMNDVHDSKLFEKTEQNTSKDVAFS